MIRTRVHVSINNNTIAPAVPFTLSSEAEETARKRDLESATPTLAQKEQDAYSAAAAAADAASISGERMKEQIAAAASVAASAAADAEIVRHKQVNDAIERDMDEQIQQKARESAAVEAAEEAETNAAQKRQRDVEAAAFWAQQRVVEEAKASEASAAVKQLLEQQVCLCKICKAKWRWPCVKGHF